MKGQDTIQLAKGKGIRCESGKEKWAGKEEKTQIKAWKKKVFF